MAPNSQRMRLLSSSRVPSHHPLRRRISLTATYLLLSPSLPHNNQPRRFHLSGPGRRRAPQRRGAGEALPPLVDGHRAAPRARAAQPPAGHQGVPGAGDALLRGHLLHRCAPPPAPAQRASISIMMRSNCGGRRRREGKIMRRTVLTPHRNNKPPSAAPLLFAPPRAARRQRLLQPRPPPHRPQARPHPVRPRPGLRGQVHGEEDPPRRLRAAVRVGGGRVQGARAQLRAAGGEERVSVREEGEEEEAAR